MVGNRVLVSTRGACASCAAAQLTLKDFVEAKLQGVRNARTAGGGGGPMTVDLSGQQRHHPGGPEVLEAMLPYLSRALRQPFQHALLRRPGGPEACGRPGNRWRPSWAPHPDEIIFTSCGTESDNTAIRSALATLPDKRHIVTTRVEHPAINALVARLAKEGYRVTETAGGRPGAPEPGPV